MKTNDAWYYLDANALWKYYRDEVGSLNMRRLIANAPHPCLISPLTTLEFVGVLMRYFRQGQLKCRAIRKIIARLTREAKPNLQTHRPFATQPLPTGAFQQAESLQLQYGGTFSIGANDCLHLAMAIRWQANFPTITMITSNRALKNVCIREGMTIYDPEKET
jgi:predicted nucleic acid-binding protein